MALIPISSFGIESIRDLVQWMPPLASWKTLALVLALLNIKSLPFSWHVCCMFFFQSPSLFSPIFHGNSLSHT